jgi:hypothetical protein
LQYTDAALKGHFGWLPSVPAAKVAGTFNFQGKSLAVTGTGYHDHNWGNRLMSRFVSTWLWGRIIIDDFYMIFATIYTAKSYSNGHIPILMVKQGNRLVTDNGYPLQVKTSNPEKDPISGRSYPTFVELDWQNGGKICATLTNPRLIQGCSFLYEMPMWQQKIVNLVYRPYYFRFETDLQLTVELPGVSLNTRGSAIYEWMLLD